MATNATNTTPNFGLSQWEPEDHVLREDFNSDNAIIDSELAKIGSKAKIVAGTYVGTGTSGVNNMNVLTFDFQPKFLAVGFETNPGSGQNYNRFFAFYNCDYATNDREGSTLVAQILSWENNSVKWYCSTSTSATSQYNQTGKRFSYVVIG